MASEEPPKFSWVEEGLLCACAFPDKKEHLKFLVDNGVSVLVTLTAERQVSSKDLHDVGLECVEFPVRDFTPPTLEQAENFVQLILKLKSGKKAACVHCAGGKGRTGTMLACYFVRARGMKAEEAIAHVRKLREGSIETLDQEALIATYAEHCQSGAAQKK